MKWLTVTLLVLAVLILCLGVYLQPNSLALCPYNNGEPSTRSSCAAAEAIVAVSGGDTVARTQKAVDLYNKGWAPLIIFSGAAQDTEGPSNAAAMRQYALTQGVPASAILIEELSQNTSQNAEKTRALLQEYHISDILLVTSGYHQRRASIEFATSTKDDGVTIRNVPTNDKDWNWWWWLTPRGWWLAGGELVKIVAHYVGGSEVAV